MKRMYRNIFTAVLVGSLFAIVQPASAEGGRGQNPDKMVKHLDLTADQQEKFEKIRSEFQGTLRPKREEMKTARKDLEAALRGNASDAEVRKKFDELNQKQSEFAKARFEKVMAIRAILTPQQREKLRSEMGHDKGFRKKFGRGFKKDKN